MLPRTTCNATTSAPDRRLDEKTQEKLKESMSLSRAAAGWEIRSHVPGRCGRRKSTVCDFDRVDLTNLNARHFIPKQ